MVRVLRICGKCSAAILIDEPEGLCAACVLETSLGMHHDEVNGAGGMEMPEELGDYQLMEEIGRGGQGLVYRARQKSLNRIVALKVIGLGRWATTAHIKRFRLEAEAAASLDHPCIVPIHEIGESGGSCYFSMNSWKAGDSTKLSGASQCRIDARRSSPSNWRALFIMPISGVSCIEISSRGTFCLMQTASRTSRILAWRGSSRQKAR